MVWVEVVDQHGRRMMPIQEKKVPKEEKPVEEVSAVEVAPVVEEKPVEEVSAVVKEAPVKKTRTKKAKT